MAQARWTRPPLNSERGTLASPNGGVRLHCWACPTPDQLQQPRPTPPRSSAGLKTRCARGTWPSPAPAITGLGRRTSPASARCRRAIGRGARRGPGHVLSSAAVYQSGGQASSTSRGSMRHRRSCRQLLEWHAGGVGRQREWGYRVLLGSQSQHGPAGWPARRDNGPAARRGRCHSRAHFSEWHERCGAAYGGRRTFRS